MSDEEKQIKRNVAIYHKLEDVVIFRTFSFPCTEMLIRERCIVERLVTGLLAKILKENNILQVQINIEHLRKR